MPAVTRDWKQAVTALVTLALCGSMPTVAAAQGASEEKQALRPWTDICEGKALKDEDLPYPFSVTEVASAYAIAKLAVRNDIQDVKVLVIDNGFGSYAEHYPNLYFAENHKKQPTWDPIEEPPTEIKPNELSHWGHGRHVVGVIMGGDPEPESPMQVRKLLHDEGETNPWLSIYVIGVGEFDRNGDKLNVDKLPTLDTIIAEHKPLSKSVLRPDIVNMSIIQHLTGQSTPALTLQLGSPLFVVAAGNGVEDLGKTATGRFPAKAAAAGLLVVASHDAKTPLNPAHGRYGGGTLSKFSNYGAKFVEIAAPGCQIRSWLRGSGDATPLSGTSFATGVVTFAASLVKSLHDKLSDPSDVKNRLLSSSRYSEPLLNCVPGPKVETAPNAVIDRDAGCVRYGSQLDIEIALLAHTDVIEYCDTKDEEACDRRIAYGDLRAVPKSLKDCVGGTIMDGHEMTQPGVSRKGALRAVGGRAFQALYPRMIGDVETIEAKQCMVAAGEAELFVMTDARQLLQPDTSKIGNLEIEAKRVLRLVTRSVE